MKNIWLIGTMAILFLAAAAQDLAPAGFELWTPSSFKQLEAKLQAGAATDPHHSAVELLADFPNDSAMLVHREADGQAEWHENQADIFVVQSGSATLLVGGTMENSQTVAPHEKRASHIQGGVREPLSAGDIVRIPRATPHQLLVAGSPGFTYFTVKIKGY